MLKIRLDLVWIECELLVLHDRLGCDRLTD